MACLADVVIDCHHPASLARSWAAALDRYDVAPYDNAELARLRAEGIYDPEDDPTVLVEASGRTPRIFLVKVPEPKAGKNRVHLDLRTPDLEAEVARLRGLGASELARVWYWVVTQDPEGNEFDVLPERSEVTSSGSG